MVAGCYLLIVVRCLVSSFVACCLVLIVDVCWLLMYVAVCCVLFNACCVVSSGHRRLPLSVVVVCCCSLFVVVCGLLLVVACWSYAAVSWRLTLLYRVVRRRLRSCVALCCLLCVA